MENSSITLQQTINSIILLLHGLDQVFMFLLVYLPIDSSIV